MTAETGLEYYDGRSDAQHLMDVKHSLVALQLDAPTALTRQDLLNRIAGVTGIEDISVVQNLLHQIVNQAIKVVQASASPNNEAKIMPFPARATHNTASQQTGSSTAHIVVPTPEADPMALMYGPNIAQQHHQGPADY